MADFLQLFFSGMATGSIYALAALGFTLLWQASGTINFAQGEFVMLPAFLMIGFGAFGAPLLLSFALSCAVAVVVLGWAFKRGIADPLLRFGLMPIVVATIGLSIAMRNGIRAGYSAEAHPFPSLFADKLFWLGLPLAMIGCFVIGLGLGFPALRVQTIYLAFATPGFNTAVWLVMRNEEWLTGGTGSAKGRSRARRSGSPWAAAAAPGTGLSSSCCVRWPTRERRC